VSNHRSRETKNKVNDVLEDSPESHQPPSHEDPAAQNLILEAEIKSLRERMRGETAVTQKNEATAREDVVPAAESAPEKTTAPSFGLKRILDEFPRRSAIAPEKSDRLQEELKNENERLRREINGLNAKVSAQEKSTERIKTLRQRLAEVERKRQAMAAALVDFEQELKGFGRLLKDDAETQPTDPAAGSRDAPQSIPEMDNSSPKGGEPNPSVSPSRQRSNKLL
jgi:hypothetical protein